MNVEVNYAAVFLAAASSMVVGSVWYAKPVFGKLWMKLIDKKEKDLTANAAKAIGLTFVASLFTAYILAHVTFLSNRFFGNSYLQDAVTTAFWMWLGFTAARFLTHDLFENRPSKLTLLNVAHELVTFVVMGIFIGLLQP